MSMEEMIAPVDGVIFDIETMIEGHVGVLPMNFATMDKSSAATCNFFKRGCHLERLCPFRHVTSQKKLVCKHWLRGLCKKGDNCEYQHVYDTTKMPECYFYAMLNSCTNKECIFRHSKSKIPVCLWYNRGFCKRGPQCRMKHVKRILCPNYNDGFCPKGPNCSMFHSKFNVIPPSFTQTPVN